MTSALDGNPVFSTRNSKRNSIFFLASSINFIPTRHDIWQRKRRAQIFHKFTIRIKKNKRRIPRIHRMQIYHIIRIFYVFFKKFSDLMLFGNILMRIKNTIQIILNLPNIAIIRRTIGTRNKGNFSFFERPFSTLKILYRFINCYTSTFFVAMDRSKNENIWSRMYRFKTSYFNHKLLINKIYKKSL